MKKQNIMKKLVYATMLMLGLGIPFISYGNVDSRNDKSIVTKDEAYQKETDTVFPEETCVSILNRLYNDYIFEDQFDQFGQVVDELFTAKAKQKLIEKYDYDCEDVCYAIWALRANAQDGKDDAKESRIDMIWQALDNVYEVEYVYMGWHGNILFLFASENGNVKIDDFVKQIDESVEGFGYWSEGLRVFNINGLIDQGEIVLSDEGDIFEGEYLFTEGDYYIVVLQDYDKVPIAGHRKVTYSAENGQGFIFTYDANVNIMESPSTNSAVVAVMPISVPIGEEMEDYKHLPCLGKNDGWYKTSINGKVGYVREDMAIWTYTDIW